MTTKDDGVMRSFDTGATRDTAEGKLDFEGFLHPLFLEQFAKYMNMHRLQSDGTLRDSDNWQKGIPQDICMKSLFRHFFEMWKLHRNGIYNREQYRDFMAGAMGIIFNVQAYVLQDLQDEMLGLVDFDGDEPTDEMEERQAKVNEAKRQAVKKEVKEEYQSALTDIINDIHESKDAPCECCPGDCDCGSTGRIYGFAMPTDIYVDGDREDDWKITTEAPEEDVQVGEVPLPDWVPSARDAVDAVIEHVGEDHIKDIYMEVDDVECIPCRFFKLSPDDHPCDCCDEDYSNFSRK